MTGDTNGAAAAGPLEGGGPLAGVRVLDLSWVLAGPYCTMVLADLGADVVKCERPPFGDVARTTGPLVDGESGYFFSINRGKRSIAIDLKLDEGRELFLRLVPEFDVIVENFRPGTLERLGLGYETLAEVHPRLVYLAISGYGQDGPMRDRPALDVVVQGAGGVMSITGEPGGGPVRPGLSLGDIAGGLFGAVGVLSALRERDQSGLGQFVDVSMLDCQLAILENAFLRYHLTGQTPEPMGTRHSWAVPFQAFPTADGHLVIALAWGVPNQWALLCSELGLVELIDDPRFAESHQRSANHAELEPLLNEAFRKRPTADWLERLEPYGIPCGPVNNIAEAAAHPQVAAREMLVPVEHPKLGTLPLVNTPVKLSRTPGGIRATSPDMGQHTREVLAERLGLDADEVEALVAAQVVWEERPPVDLA
ncbi:MAG: CaiB/BaiF CoA-transferase family protein [Chloroflexota bacterium]|nr:CaiB/BaiF CoA-transferase family protein [Chloroflexota bacterium]